MNTLITQGQDPDVPLVQSGGKVWTTSTAVAEKFGKRHDTVLRAIRELECSSDFMLRNFAEHGYVDGRGNTQPAYRMTRDGFVFLAMGFTGKEAARWKERFICAFNSMESALYSVRDAGNEWIERILTGQHRLSEALAESHVAVRADLHEVKVEVADVKARVIALESHRGRRDITDSVKNQHRAIVKARGGRCPYCERQAEQFEFDHYFDNSKRNFEHTWPLCPPCHASLSHGRRHRNDVNLAFHSYQEFAKRVFHSQPALPGFGSSE